MARTFDSFRGRTHTGRVITRLLFGAFTPFVRFFHAASRPGERDENARRAKGEVTRGRERKSERKRETHVRATTMYFGAALHTPRGGQCPSLLRLKEGAEGREGWREQGGGASRSRGRQGGEHRRGVEKNEQTSSERWRGRVAEGRPAALSLSLLSSFPFFFSLVLSSLSLSPGLSLFLDCPSVSLYGAPSAAAAGFLLPERFPLNVKIRGSTARRSPLSFSRLSFSARFILRTHTSIIRAL